MKIDDISDNDIISSYERVMDLHTNATPDEGIDILISYYYAAYTILSDVFIEEIRYIIHDSINNDPIANYERAMQIIT